MNSFVKNKWVRGVAWVVVGVLALWALCWLAVPPILKSQAQKIASEQLGRKVTLGAVEFKPWTLELTLHDLVVASSDASFEQVHVNRLYADAELQSVLRLAPVVDAVSVDGVALKLTHLGGGKYDIDDVLQRLARPSEKPASDKPARFALYNLSLTGLSLDYVDKAVDRTQQVRDLTLTLPFLSSLEAQRNVNVEPRLAFTLNGSRFDSAAQSLPFAQSRKTDATLSFKNLDLAPYLGYLPSGLPVKLQSAVIDADVKIGFEQSPAVAVKLSGSVKAHDVRVADAADGELLSVGQLNVVATDVQPLARIAKVASVEVVAPKVAVTRDAAGRLNLAMGGAADSTAASQASAPASASARSDAPKPWAVEVAKVSVREGTVVWTDEAAAGIAASKPPSASASRADSKTPAATAPAAASASPDHASVTVQDVALDASQIALPFAHPLVFSGSAALDAPNSGQLKFNGQATDQAATVAATLDGVSLDVAAPYLASFIEPTLAGQLSADFKLDWAASGALTVDARTVTIDGLALTSKTDKSIDAMDDSTASRPSARTAASKASARKAASPARSETAAGKTAAGKARPATTASASRTQPAASEALGSRLPRGTLATVRQFQLADTRLDLAAQKVSIGRLALIDARARVVRDAGKHWMFEQWLRSPATPSAPAPHSASRKEAAASVAAKPWAVAIDDLSVEGAAVSYADLAGIRPVRVDLSSINVQVKNFSPDATRPSPLTVSARVAARRSEPGTLGFKGTLGLTPLAASGQVQMSRLPLHAFEPYFAAGLNVQLQRADTSFIGKLNYLAAPKGPTLSVQGNGQVDNFRADSIPESAAASAETGTTASGTAATAAGSAPNHGPVRSTTRSAGVSTTTARPAPRNGGATPLPSLSGSVASTLQDASASGLAEELLSWKALNLRGVDVAMKPGSPTSVDVKETALSDFFARVIVKETGRINLQDLVKSGDEASAALASPASAAASSEGAPRANTTAASASAAAVNTASAAPLIRFGPISLVNGQVLFSDHFIRPNYSASLSELTGKLSAFSSVSPDGAPQLADLELRGRAENTASLEITGKLNPLAKPLALDITGKVRDLELPPLSPYSVKYAGYGIERGKMSVDVNYVVQPDGQLIAKNKLVLNQLTFGDKVEGAPNSLPVKLAVALLADRNGVIDLDLPISGSLNDPQFSLFPVILKVIGNVIVKAITSPFSLLASAFNGGTAGGEGLDGVAFAPGSTVLDAPARATLDKVAKALTDRPALKLTVTGSANVEAEREAYKRERLMQLVQAEKRRASAAGAPAAPRPASAASGASAGASGAAPATSVSPAEYPELLKAVYKSADIAKPRNLIGLTKDIPTAEMEALLLSHITVTDESIRELAVERGVAVRDYLASRDLPLDRLFLGAAKAQKAPAAAGAEQRFTPRAELSLTAQ